MSTHPRPSTNQLLEPAEREYRTTPLVDKYGLGSKAIMPPYYLNVQFPMGPIYTQFDVLSTLSSHQARSPNRQVNPQFATAVFENYVNGKLAKGRSRYDASYKLEDLERGLPHFARSFHEARTRTGLPPSRIFPPLTTSSRPTPPITRVGSNASSNYHQRRTSAASLGRPSTSYTQGPNVDLIARHSNVQTVRPTTTSGSTSSPASAPQATTTTTSASATATAAAATQGDPGDLPPPPYSRMDPEPEMTAELERQLSRAQGQSNTALPETTPSSSSNNNHNDTSEQVQDAPTPARDDSMTETERRELEQAIEQSRQADLIERSRLAEASIMSAGGNMHEDSLSSPTASSSMGGGGGGGGNQASDLTAEQREQRELQAAIEASERQLTLDEERRQSRYSGTFGGTEDSMAASSSTTSAAHMNQGRMEHGFDNGGYASEKQFDMQSPSAGESNSHAPPPPRVQVEPPSRDSTMPPQQQQSQQAHNSGSLTSSFAAIDLMDDDGPTGSSGGSSMIQQPVLQPVKTGASATTPGGLPNHQTNPFGRAAPLSPAGPSTNPFAAQVPTGHVESSTFAPPHGPPPGHELMGGGGGGSGSGGDQATYLPPSHPPPGWQPEQEPLGTHHAPTPENTSSTSPVQARSMNPFLQPGEGPPPPIPPKPSRPMVS